MSKERDLLQEALGWMHELKYVWANVRDSGDYDVLELVADIKKIEELLAQHEQDLQEDIREGITLRDHFACAAMQGLLVSMKFKSGDLCLTAYSFADLMLAEGEKEHD